ncbi:hypothetical protein HK098_007216 [Nowakowskiella sp. JEL0407]|nr:hypothetical protein HK098_007216 [Nowakowskiella sp. JEL0407]
MYDPHTKDSRGFGFICFEKVEEAEAAIAALNGYELHGRRITVEKAKRGKARPPTPGSYFGPTRARPPRDVMLPPWFYPDPRFPDRFDPRYDMREMFRTPRDFRGPSLYPPVERGYYGRSSYDRAYPERYESRREDRDRDRRRYDDPRDSRDSYRSRGY